MNHNLYIYMAVMALVTYLIRVLPLTLIRKEITNVYIRSFLFYVPYVTLSVMTFPAILEATQSPVSAALSFICAIFLALKGKSLVVVSVLACIVVFVSELIIL